MNRPQRRAVTLAGLVMDTLAAITLAVTAFLGMIPARSTLAPAVTLAIGIACGTAYLYLTRSRP